MVEKLNESNVFSFEKLFNKALKKHDFIDIQTMNAEKCILLYKEGTNYVGFLEGFVEKSKVTNLNVGHIVALYVLPSYRNEGKAYSMMLKFEEWIKEYSCSDIVVGMSLKDKKSLDFFEKYSFENMGTHIFMKKSVS